MKNILAPSILSADFKDLRRTVEIRQKKQAQSIFILM